MTFIYHPNGKVMFTMLVDFFLKDYDVFKFGVSCFSFSILAYTLEEDCKVFKIVVICYASPFLYLILFP